MADFARENGLDSPSEPVIDVDPNAEMFTANVDNPQVLAENGYTE